MNTMKDHPSEALMRNVELQAEFIRREGTRITVER